MLLRKKCCFSMRVLKFFQDLCISCLQELRIELRTENSFSVNVWLKSSCVMFLLYWEVYVLMDLVVNFRNKDLHWFCRRRTFIDGLKSQE